MLYRSTIAGLALFSAGAATGFLTSQLLAPSGPAGAVVAQQVIDEEVPVSAVRARPTVPARRPAAPTETTLAETGGGISENGENKQANAATVAPVREARPEAIAPVRLASVKMAETASASPALQKNPIVLRELTREIQKELYRVGCYSVIVSGKWDERTVKASTQFVANRNSVLPAARPDVVLLSLLRSYQGGDCGGKCQADETGDGTCAPRQIVASTEPSPVPALRSATRSRPLSYAATPVRQEAVVSPRPAKRAPARKAPRRAPVKSQAEAAQVAEAPKKPMRWRQQVFGQALD